MEDIHQHERRNPEPLDRDQDHRTPFERDLARLIHSAAFRRLQSKTQVLGIGEGDFHRTRLTHSMEVAQVGRGIVKNLDYRLRETTDSVRYLPDSDLISCICLAHDLGHPPFGHGGETALNYCMRHSNGFEGNAQTLRILSKLEAHTSNYGLNLTRRSLLGVLKYPASYSLIRRIELPTTVTDRIYVRKGDWKPPKCYYHQDNDVFEWLIKYFDIDDIEKYKSIEPPSNDRNGKTKEKTLDASIMEIADDIAYGVHDLEDAIVLSLVDQRIWEQIEGEIDTQWARENNLTGIEDKLFSADSSERKRSIGSLVHAFITNTQIEEVQFNDPLLKYRVILIPEAKHALKKLRDTITNNVIKIPEVQTLEYRGQQIVMQIFEAIGSDPDRLLKANFLKLYHDGQDDDEKLRIISDYISGMTDEYATMLYERLFLPRHGTIFKRL
jgi:dGTPase